MTSQILLNTHWRCEYLNDEPHRRIDGFSVPALMAFDTRRIEAKWAWFEHAFDLPQPDECINYELHIEALPVGTHLTLNGRALGEVDLPLALDVTDIVALEDNLIVLRVPRNAAGRFGVVALRAIPCE